jgi:hypothetical protein
MANLFFIATLDNYSHNVFIKNNQIKRILNATFCNPLKTYTPIFTFEALPSTSVIILLVSDNLMPVKLEIM